MPSPNFDRTIDHNEWVLDFCRAREAWAAHQTKGENVVIAQADVGWTDHPQLPFDTSAHTYNNYGTNRSIDFTERSSQKPWQFTRKGEDELRNGKQFLPGHGTSTASVIISPQDKIQDGRDPRDSQIGNRDSKAFVTGVAPGASLIPYRVTKGNVILFGQPDLNAIERCLMNCIYQFDNGLNDIGIFTMSLGGHELTTLVKNVADFIIHLKRPFNHGKVEKALREVRRRGIVIFSAGGQIVPDCFDINPFPATDPNVIGVSACEITDAPFRDGVYGKHIAVSAPGFEVWRAGTTRNNALPHGKDFFVERSEGSSYATAIAAGVCALWQSRWGRDKLIGKRDLSGPGNTREPGGRYPPHHLMTAFLMCLENTARKPVGFDREKYGCGIIDAKALLDFPLPEPDLVKAEHLKRFPTETSP
jgi:serine protease